MASSKINAVRSTTGEQPDHRRVAEDAAQTFLDGVPVMMKLSTGGIVEWDGTTYLAGIAGFAKENASNLATLGVAQTLSYGKVANQPSAVIIPAGAPLNDGRIGFDVALDSTVFKGQVGPSQTTAVTDPGKSYGLTKDSDNHWYVDKTKTLTSGGSSSSQAVVVVVGLDQFDTTRGVRFKVMSVAQQQVI